MGEDQELMELLKAGDPRALEQLIERWRERAESYAVGILHDRQAAEDAVMEAFARIYASRSRYEPKCAFGTWFLTVVRRICIDEIRKATHQPVPVPEIPETGTESAETEALHRMEREDRIRILAGFDETERRILLGFSLEGKTTGQLAKELSMTDGQVRVRLHRIRKKLRKGADDANES
ncbi:MAG: sigma-70 family RNA polymerase sigma factor [Clostridia bacterium]|nr:sigma-70 family RNA polymerase sigma factor [Clostridia bacterium]